MSDGWNDVPLCADPARRAPGCRRPSKTTPTPWPMASSNTARPAAARHVVCITLGTGRRRRADPRRPPLPRRAARRGRNRAHEHRLPRASRVLREHRRAWRNTWAIIRSPSGPWNATARPARKSAPKIAPLWRSRRAAHSGDAIADRSSGTTSGHETRRGAGQRRLARNPDTIVIGGGVANAGELIFEPIRRRNPRRTLALFHEKLRIVPAALGNDAGIIGNAILALEAADEA